MNTLSRLSSCALTAWLVASPAFSAEAPPPRLLQTPEVVGEEIRLTFRSPGVPAPPAGKEKALVWTQPLDYPGASYIAPHFSAFSLPDGAAVVVRSPKGERSWTYSGKGQGAGDGFWGIHIAGDQAIVELWTSQALPEGAVVIQGFAHGFKDLGGPPPEAICGTNDSQWAACYQASEPTAYGRARAVARLLINGTGFCTGWLVGSAGHLLTNQHCIGSQSDASNTNFEFMAEGACGTNCSSQGSCPGTVVATSSTLVRSSFNLDYALVQLPTNPTATYGFLQLRNGSAVVNERIYIPGHPGGGGKRIALASTHSSDASGFCEVFSLNEPGCDGRPGPDVGYFCDTEGGSSGSPVLATADQGVVALHHCANCPNRAVPIQAVISDLGASLPPNALIGPPPPVTLVFHSNGAEDGRVAESSETSNVGGTVHATATGGAAIRIGDNDANEQIKGFLSFRTETLPDNANITAATVRVLRGGSLGNNPFLTHGPCRVDVVAGNFNANFNLEAADFQAPATAVNAGTLSNAAVDGQWSEANLTAAGRSAINRVGRTQVRLYCVLDDDNDLTYDYVGYWSADSGNQANMPQLVVTYQP
ncbi:MAG TPA: trypsin-like peptidase domain-containing protein [Thermoanaerobaculia bacterium]|nr:trypsin-like peptidase domain-containing protein [Thermoanaerobaculia bacterium]